MSGGASVVLTFLPIVFPRLFTDAVWAVRSIWIATVLCFLVANYSAWKYERDKYEKEKAKNEIPPDIDLQMLTIIPRGKISAGVTDLFVYARMKLKAPTEVNIKAFALTLLGFTESMTISAVEDVEDWETKKEVNAEEFHYQRCVPALTKSLTQRGDPVCGWLHFELGGLRESVVQGAGLQLKANCDHGTCTSEIISGAYARTDMALKGTMRRVVKS